MLSFSQFLTEKLIILNGGKPYGQVVFMGGGAGSGKGFAVNHFIEGNKFHVFDVDEIKQLVLKLERIHREYLMTAKKDNPYAKIGGLNLRNPKDVFALHMFAKERKYNDKMVDFLLTAASNKQALPNILFDTTLKDFDDFAELVPRLLKIGYQETDIHFIWVLTNFSLALKRNAGRDRVVSDDIMLATHAGAADTLTKIIFGGMLPKFVNGSGYVILSNQENTVFYDGQDGQKLDGAKMFFTKDGSPVPSSHVREVEPEFIGPSGFTPSKQKQYVLRSTGEPVIMKQRSIAIKDFTYIKVKDTGKPLKPESEFKHDLFSWIYNNIPSHKDIADILSRKRISTVDQSVDASTYRTIAKAAKKIDNVRSRRNM